MYSQKNPKVILFYYNSFAKRHGVKVTTGGSSRYNAWLQYAKKKVDNCRVVILPSNRILRILLLFSFLVTKRRHQFVFLYPAIGINIGNPFFINVLLSKLYCKILNYASRYNEIIVDVSDIKYEQYIDLEIRSGDLKTIQTFENMFFRTNARFIFASNGLRNYALEKFGISYNQTDVSVNGGWINESINQSSFCFEDDSIYFVYSGSLSRSRSIAEIIDSFPEIKERKLLLMGADGEWIEDYNTNPYVYYLGEVAEEEAHAIVSNCDVGLIPYDVSKTYFNLAFPTKLPFYLTAGVAVLATKTDELSFIRDLDDFAFVLPINEWKGFFETLPIDEVNRKKEYGKMIRNRYTWDQTLKNPFIKERGDNY